MLRALLKSISSVSSDFSLTSIGGVVMCILLFSFTDIADISFRLLLLPLLYLVGLSCAVGILAALLSSWLYGDDFIQVENARKKILLEILFLGIGLFLLIGVSLYASVVYKKVVYALNPSILVTESATILSTRGTGNPSGTLFLVHHNIELDNGEKHAVSYPLPSPHLKKGKTYELLMTPELDTIVQAQEIE